MFGKEVKRPARSPFWRLATGEGDEMSFVTSVKCALVNAVGLAAIYRRQAVLHETFADTSDRPGMAANGLTDLLVSQAVISM